MLEIERLDWRITHIHSLTHTHMRTQHGPISHTHNIHTNSHKHTHTHSRILKHTHTMISVEVDGIGIKKKTNLSFEVHRNITDDITVIKGVFIHREYCWSEEEIEVNHYQISPLTHTIFYTLSKHLLCIPLASWLGVSEYLFKHREGNFHLLYFTFIYPASLCFIRKIRKGGDRNSSEQGEWFRGEW